MSQKRVSITMPAEFLAEIEKRAKAENITRQQLLLALLDLGLGRPRQTPGTLGPLAVIGLLRRVQDSNNSSWQYQQLREALWAHLRSLCGGKPE